MLEVKKESKEEFNKKIEAICFAAGWKKINVSNEKNKIFRSPVPETSKNYQPELDMIYFRFKAI